LMPIARRHIGSGPMRRQMKRFEAGLFVGTVVGWIGLSGAIVLPWAATDNLTELIAQRGPFGIPGPVFLLGICVLLAGHVSVLLNATQSVARGAWALLYSVAAVPAGWALLNRGLEQQVQKYNLVFSGTQFLLGPDRQHSLGGGALFTRWAVVYTGAVAVIVCGAWLFNALAPHARSAIWPRRPAAAGAS
jgi:hypothetical protein